MLLSLKPAKISGKRVRTSIFKSQACVFQKRIQVLQNNLPGLGQELCQIVIHIGDKQFSTAGSEYLQDILGIIVKI